MHQRRMIIAGICLALLFGAPTVRAADGKPYDQKLFQLTEVLGALHYLRALCGGADGQTWRAHVEALLQSEGTTALRRAVIAKRFNRGYRNYSRTYRSCTVTAKAAMKRFVTDAQVLSDALLDHTKTGDGAG